MIQSSCVRLNLCSMIFDNMGDSCPTIKKLVQIFQTFEIHRLLGFGVNNLPTPLERIFRVSIPKDAHNK